MVNACVECGSIPIYGKGYCRRCYQRHYMRKWRESPLVREKYRQLRKEYYKKHRDECIESFRRYAFKIKKEALTHYSNGEPKCACCGEKRIEFLCIDHINGKGNEQRKRVGWGTSFYRWLRKSNYPPGFQILCWNCNHAKAIYGRCPHQKELMVREE